MIVLPLENKINLFVFVLAFVCDLIKSSNASSKSEGRFEVFLELEAMFITF